MIYKGVLMVMAAVVSGCNIAMGNWIIAVYWAVLAAYWVVSIRKEWDAAIHKIADAMDMDEMEG